MNLARVRGRMRRIRAEYEEMEEESGELNLVPYLDIATNVVMFLLATVTFSAPLAGITIAAPKLQGGGGGGDQVKALKLAIEVSPKGFIVAGDDPLLEPKTGGKRVAKLPDGEYDWKTLTEILVKVKDAHPKEDSILVALDPYLPYELLIRTFDAVRADGDRLLFPNSTLGVGE